MQIGGDYMKEEELRNIKGGSITATFVSAISRGVNTLYNVGRALGSAIRRTKDGRMCPL